ncbi:uncharacterized protein LOC128951463 [Oppia nitens]|uniref:uncharacterized protein LOC128951463 n=1 Tax=Oppia nitens TaxID=1686743 RepID=UPI0023DBF00A|nr:uncharacterized protein LOC128951463 [Oppia nitens]
MENISPNRGKTCAMTREIRELISQNFTDIKSQTNMKTEQIVQQLMVQFKRSRASIYKVIRTYYRLLKEAGYKKKKTRDIIRDEKIKCPGKRYNVIHVGGEDGFVENGLFLSVNEELNSEKFENWMETQVIPNLKEKCVIVYDNAKIHSRILNKGPKSNWRVNQIKEWLNNNNISFNDKLKKKDLLILAKKHKKVRKYALDELIKKAGHIPLRTPPYNCDVSIIISFMLIECPSLT